MKERPILFSSPMVRAILSGQKTQTRRVVKGQALDWLNDGFTPGFVADYQNRLCPYGQPGDRLWVRETWQGPLLESDEQIDEFRQSPDTYKKPGFCAYRATDTLDAIDQDGKELGWRPSIHMPRWASRTLLEVTGVRVERLQDISEDDAIEEGILSVRSQQWDLENFKEWRIEFDDAVASGKKPPVGPSPKAAFSALWESINGPGSWDANPWVWVVELKRLEGGAA